LWTSNEEQKSFRIGLIHPRAKIACSVALSKSCGELNSPHLYANLEDRWLTPRLVKMGLDEEGMGWHSFKRFRKTWLRGRRCLEDINNFWMAHKPETMSELYSHLHEELELRREEVERVGCGFDLPQTVIAPNAPKKSIVKSDGEIAA
jgi:hypothetical protein